MIEIDIRRKAYGDTPVLQNVRLSLREGEIVAILGPSGTGKSTLLRIVAGIDTAFEGKIDRPERIAMVFQEPVLLPWRTALQNVTLVHPSLSGDEARSMLARTGIADKADFYPGQMSLGQQRRLALARAFAGRPQLLILDEPYVSLDPETAEEMMRLTEDLIAAVRPTVLLVTHAHAEAERLAERIFILRDARLTAEQKPSGPVLRRQLP